MNKVVVLIVSVILTACSTNNYVGNSSSLYEGLSCPIEKAGCDILFSNDGRISYTVNELGNNQYRIQGSVNLYMQVVGGMHPKVSFYILFMDDNQVLFERKVKTGNRKATFEFEVETEKPISKTSVAKVLYHTWS